MYSALGQNGLKRNVVAPYTSGAGPTPPLGIMTHLTLPYSSPREEQPERTSTPPHTEDERAGICSLTGLLLTQECIRSVLDSGAYVFSVDVYHW